MLDLDALVASARQSVEEKAAAKKKPDLAPRTLPDAEPAYTPTWAPTGLCFRRERWDCACGSHGMRPLGLFVLQTHTQITASRFVAIRHESELPPLPRYLHTEELIVSLCPDCAPEHGFSTVWVAPRPPATVSNHEGRGAGFVEEWNALRAAEAEQEEEIDLTEEGNDETSET